MDRQTEADWLTDIQTHIETDRQNRQADKKRYRCTGGQTDRHTQVERGRDTDEWMYRHAHRN